MSREREMKTIRAMIAIYCQDHHHVAAGSCAMRARRCSSMLRPDLANARGVTRNPCVPTARSIAIKPAMRDQVRQVMRYAGPKMLLRHPLLAVSHLLQKRKAHAATARRRFGNCSDRPATSTRIRPLSPNPTADVPMSDACRKVSNHGPMIVRNIVEIDEAKCDGCGHCVPACEEGAIRLIDGKARVVSETYCDGLGACLGHCPRGAISIVQRPAAAVRSGSGGSSPAGVQRDSRPPACTACRHDAVAPDPAPCNCRCWNPAAAVLSTRTAAAATPVDRQPIALD